MMSKLALALVALLTVTALVGVPLAAFAVGDAADAVTITPNHLWGDPALLDGLSVSMRNTLGDYLHWSIAYRPERGEITTDYAMSVLRSTDQSPELYRGVSLENGFHYGYSLGGMAGDDPEATGLLKAYNDLYASCPVGESRSMVVRLADLYDYYPITGKIDLPGVSCYLDWEDAHLSYTPTPESEKYVGWRINQYFKIPLLGDEQIEISIDRGGNGHTVGIGSTSTGGTKIRMGMLRTESAVAEDVCYFAVSITAEDGSTFDTSHIEGGYGIYALPFDGTNRVNIDALRNVYPLDPADGDPFALYLSADETDLLLYRRIDDRLTLTVIDRATMTEQQTLTVFAGTAETVWPVVLRNCGDFHVLTVDYAHLCLVERDEAGEYAVRLSLPVDADSLGLGDVDAALSAALRYQYPTQVMAWDGARLLLADQMTQSRSDRIKAGACDFYLAVLTADGLGYLGLCQTSLNAPTDKNNSTITVWPADVDPISVAWD